MTTQQLPLELHKAALYARVSTEDQATNGFGLDVQRERCRAMATVKGWEVVAEYCDDGISGTLDADSRPGLTALLDAANAGDVSAVIVLSLDRLGRKTTLVLDLVERLTSAGVEVVSVKEQLDTSTPTGRFVLTMFAALSQLERDTIVQRTTDGRNARGRKDGERGGSVPFGYTRIRNDKGRATGVEVDETAAAVVRDIFTMRDEGLSLRAIAENLNYAMRQIDAPRGGRTWYASTVKVILDNEQAYRGGFRGASRETWPCILC